MTYHRPPDPRKNLRRPFQGLIPKDGSFRYSSDQTVRSGEVGCGMSFGGSGHEEMMETMEFRRQRYRRSFYDTATALVAIALIFTLIWETGSLAGLW